MDIHAYWEAVARQDAAAMRACLSADALIRWHNTNELFTAEEFIRANCEYPGRWAGRVERAEEHGGQVITAVHVWAEGGAPSFHVTSFFRIKEEKICEIDEYWGEDGPVPPWRRALCIGRSIKPKGLEEEPCAAAPE